jgi:putative hydrolase of the HAD superfamily
MNDGRRRPAARGVLLDAGGVLVLPNPWAVTSVLRAAGGSLAPSDVHRLHYRATAAMDAARDRDWGRYHDVYIEAAAVPSAARTTAAAALEELFVAPAMTLWNVVPDGVVDALRDLAATGVAIAVVSNSDGTVESVLRRCEIPFDVVVDSGVVGHAKPSPEIFRVALEELGVAADDAVHVGDTAWADVDGARAAGVWPVHLDPFGDCPDPVGEHQHVRSLGELTVAVTTRVRPRPSS